MSPMIEIVILFSQACGVQAISGTGSLRLGAEFLYKNHPVKTIYFSKPTWGEDDVMAIVLSRGVMI